eukprot:CAMPEP_0195519820 /NCGR_PEP_ID=MMETSP0794_2-20130614/15570_1 /TAXON_ID=515487 /ORGANISM="Stephanopyxis turris, Strain CCMP 815" /LENGTH=655 /DNA_ID=CAMNT_0040649043 /DNA_START=120 /DNA_END=2087 /DNA_ORIENTATION=-
MKSILFLLLIITLIFNPSEVVASNASIEVSFVGAPESIKTGIGTSTTGGSTSTRQITSTTGTATKSRTTGLGAGVRKIAEESDKGSTLVSNPSGGTTKTKSTSTVKATSTTIPKAPTTSTHKATSTSTHKATTTIPKASTTSTHKTKSTSTHKATTTSLPKEGVSTKTTSTKEKDEVTDEAIDEEDNEDAEQTEPVESSITPEGETESTPIAVDSNAEEEEDNQPPTIPSDSENINNNVPSQGALEQSCANARTCNECLKGSYHLLLNSEQKYSCDWNADRSECFVMEGKAEELQCPEGGGGESAIKESYLDDADEGSIMGDFVHMFVLIGFVGGILFARKKVLSVQSNVSGGGSNSNLGGESSWGASGSGGLFGGNGGNKQVMSDGGSLARNSETVALTSTDRDEEWGWDEGDTTVEMAGVPSSATRNISRGPNIGAVPTSSAAVAAREKEEDELQLALAMSLSQAEASSSSSLPTKPKSSSQTSSTGSNGPDSKSPTPGMDTASLFKHLPPRSSPTVLTTTNNASTKKNNNKPSSSSAKQRKDVDIFASMGLAAKPTFTNAPTTNTKTRSNTSVGANRATITTSPNTTSSFVSVGTSGGNSIGTNHSGVVVQAPQKDESEDIKPTNYFDATDDDIGGDDTWGEDDDLDDLLDD